MRTIKSLKDELSKFPDDSLCCIYENEEPGLIIYSSQLIKSNEEHKYFIPELGFISFDQQFKVEAISAE